MLVPSKLQSELKAKPDKEVQVIVLIDDSDANDDLIFRQTSQGQFL